MTTRLKDANDLNEIFGKWALKFDSTKSHHVKVGTLYTPSTSYNASPMLCEAWLKPSAIAGGYWAVQGFGGKHIVLVGSFASGGRVVCSGNFHNGVQVNSYGSMDSSPADGWCHQAILYVPQDFWAGGSPATPSAFVYVNGVLSGTTASMTTPRTTGTGGDGSNDFEIGGTDHSNYDGRISQLRIFEGGLPFAPGSPPIAPLVIIPERSFRGGYYQLSDSVRVPVNLLYDFRTRWGKTIPDLGVGFNSGTHAGVLASAYSSGSVYGEADEFESNLPTWVLDELTAPVETIAAPTIPPSSIVYDSFSRADVTPAFGRTFSAGAMVLGVGNAEKAPGSTAWIGSGLTSAGIINRRAFSKSNTALPVVIETGTATHSVRINSGETGFTYMPLIVGRYADASNYVTFEFNAAGTVFCDEVIGGGLTGRGQIGAGAAAASITDFRADFAGNVVTVYVNGSSIGNFTGLTNTTGTKAGFTAGAYNRVNTFEVY